jgi:hypothetical protein
LSAKISHFKVGIIVALYTIEFHCGMDDIQKKNKKLGGLKK